MHDSHDHCTKVFRANMFFQITRWTYAIKGSDHVVSLSCGISIVESVRPVEELQEGSLKEFPMNILIRL